MGVLLYNNSPKEQLLKNSSFEEPIVTTANTENWYFSGDVVRQNTTVAFGNFAVKMGSDSVLIQEGPHLKFDGHLTLGFLCRGKSNDQKGQLNLKYEAFNKTNDLLYSKSVRLTSPSDSEFNIVYATYLVKPRIFSKGSVVIALDVSKTATYGRVTLSVVGSGTYFIDNFKGQEGREPTKWSPFSGESEISIPSAFSSFNTVNDPLDNFDVTLNSSEATKGPASSSSLETRDGTPIGSDETAVGSNQSSCLAEYDDYVKKVKKIVKAKKDQSVNREECRYFPNKEDLEILKFKREELQKCSDDFQKTSSYQRANVNLAKNKLAYSRRGYMHRVQSRQDQYAMGFVGYYLENKSLQKEETIIRDNSGAT